MYELAKKLVEAARQSKLKVAIAESCTGGMVSSAITAVPGSSEVFDRGFITYSYESKTDLLGVDPVIIKELGAVSQEVAEQMAIGAFKNSNADITVAITGIAGPSGSTANKPVGLVFFAVCANGETSSFQMIFSGDRQEVRSKASAFALEKILESIQ